MVQTDFWCSSAAVLPDGTLLQTGGYLAGSKRIWSFTPCNDEKCDWIELERNLTVQRWYASNQILPDGRIIIVGGRRAFSYEFFPKNQEDGTLNNVFNLEFLQETSDAKEENNLETSPFFFFPYQSEKIKRFPDSKHSLEFLLDSNP